MPADLVVMAHRGKSRIERFLLGSATENVLRHAPCSVWIVRGPHRSKSPSSSEAETKQ
jgi:nucleotide-binding universal stress UspA family protein